MTYAYEEKIISCFTALCAEKGGASPKDVAIRMHQLDWLSPMDTVIDIADLMKELREAGRL